MAESSANIDIRFKARIPGNFYRRVFILVKNQGPLYLDLTGKSYSACMSRMHDVPVCACVCVCVNMYFAGEPPIQSL
jgi:hypothetical protein